MSTPAWSSDKIGIVQQITSSWHQKLFDADEITRIEGILDVNTIEFFPFASSDDPLKGTKLK